MAKSKLPDSPTAEKPLVPAGTVSASPTLKPAPHPLSFKPKFKPQSFHQSFNPGTFKTQHKG